MTMTRERLRQDALSASQAHVFDRARLFVDLDEATDWTGSPSTLLVVGFRRRRDRRQCELTRNDIALLARLEEMIGDFGHIYRIGSAEVCALLPAAGDEIDELLEEIDEALVEFQRRGSVGIGYVTVPEEASDAAAALALADERLMTSARSHPRWQSPSPARREETAGVLLRLGVALPRA